MKRLALLALALPLAACSSSSPSGSVPTRAPEAEVSLVGGAATAATSSATSFMADLELGEIDPPFGYPQSGRYFRVRNTSLTPVELEGDGAGNYVQELQVMRLGVWTDLPQVPFVGTRIRQVTLAPGDESVFRGYPGVEYDRVGLRVIQAGSRTTIWSH